jgi:putative inorganic carbon (hco3(-)) transporter
VGARRVRRELAPGIALPLAGLAFFTFFFVTSRWSNLFTEVGIYLALLGLLLRPQDVSFPTPVRWAMAFLLWALVTAVFAISPERAFGEFIERLKALVIFLVVVNALRTPQQLRFYMLLILVAFLIYPVRGTFQNYVTGNRYMGRAIWNQIYSNPNDLAAITLLTMGMALAIATVRAQNSRVRWAAALFVPIMLIIILLTQSRGVFIGLLVGFGPAVVAQFRKRPSMVAPALIAVCVAAVLVPVAAWHRFENIPKIFSSETIASADPYGSAAQRLQILKSAWHIFTTHPVLGVGIGCYNEANASYAPELGKRDAHNTYLGLAAETGLPGLLLWLGLVASVMARVRRRRQIIKADDGTIQILWLERSVIAFLISCFFASYAGLTTFYLALGILWVAANVLGDADAHANAAPVRRGKRAS